MRNFRRPSVAMTAIFSLVLGACAIQSAHAQSPDSSDSDAAARRARARAAALAARADLGLSRQTTRSNPSQAELNALRTQNRSLKVDLARAEDRARTADAAAAAAYASSAASARTPAAAPVRSPEFARPVLGPLESYTGLIIDVRDLPGFERSPSPLIVGPAYETLYPNAKHVPTPDEVQDESVVRYYHTEDEARSGFVGSNPLILHAVASYGPGNDSVRLSAEDMEIVKALDEKIHFSQNWKVGFLVAGDR